MNGSRSLPIRLIVATVTCVSNVRNVDVGALNRQLGDRGYQISNGYGKLKDRTFRIAHMADTTVEQITELLSVLDELIPS